jgi:phosphatidylinositol kinase/protein kinase (PI-3  family)
MPAFFLNFFTCRLGDRHAENVTFDSTNGDCVHVDLNMLFDSGRDLPVPECVPFRLTHNLVGAMGVLGYKGLFQHTCEITLSVLLSNKDSLISVFQTYINEKEYSENVSNLFRNWGEQSY